MIEVNSKVKLKIKEDEWIGEVVEIQNNVALVKLLDNMHYHAKLNELKLVETENEITKQLSTKI